MVLIMRTQPYLTLSVMPINPSRSNRNSFWSGCCRHRHWPTRAVFRTNGADYGGGKYRRRWSARRCGGPLPGCKRTGATAVVNGSTEDVVARCQQICGKDNLGLVIECSGANIALKQAIEMLRPNGEVVRVGMGFKPLDFSINDITARNKSIIGHMAYDSTSWRNAIRLLASGAIKVKPMITHRIGLSQWREGFDAMVDKTAIKVIMTYDFDE